MHFKQMRELVRVNDELFALCCTGVYGECIIFRIIDCLINFLLHSKHS